MTSTFVCITLRETGISNAELAAYEALLRAGFAHRRKTLVNSLARAADIEGSRTAEALREIGIAERARAEQLDPGQWLALVRHLLQRRSELP